MVIKPGMMLPLSLLHAKDTLEHSRSSVSSTEATSGGRSDYDGHLLR